MESSHGSRFSGLVSHVALISRASTNDRDVGVTNAGDETTRASAAVYTGALAEKREPRVSTGHCVSVASTASYPEKPGLSSSRRK